MIVESVTVRRFRAIEEATLQLGGVTYLVGRNGAGKATFLNSLGAFFGVLPVAAPEDFHRHRTDPPIEIAVTFGRPRTYRPRPSLRNTFVMDGSSLRGRFEWNGTRVIDSFHGVRIDIPRLRRDPGALWS